MEESAQRVLQIINPDAPIIRTDAKTYTHPDYYVDKRGSATWQIIMETINDIEQEV